MRILITGGTGFVGVHLARFLKSRDCEISVLASGSSSIRESGVHYHELEIRDADRVRSLVREVNPDQIYHLAGVSAVEFSWAHPRLTYEVNVFGAQNLFDAAMDLPIPPRILNISTAQVYTAAPGMLTEHSPLGPGNPYAASKAMAELLMFQHRDRDPGGIITARSFNHTGSGQSPTFVLPSIAKQFAEIELGLRPPKLNLGNIAVKRDFTDVRDVVRAYSMLLESGKTSEVYNVCSGVSVPLSDIIKMFQAISGIEITIEVDPDKIRQKEVAYMYGDPAKIRAATGWQRQIPLEKTVEDMLDYWRSQCQTQDALPRI